MQIAIIADTHGHLDPRIAEAVSDCACIVHAGDVGADVVDALASLGPDVAIVTGNNDPADAPWPETRHLSLPGGELIVIHGHQWPAKNRHRKLRAAFPGASAVVCGHSHRQVVDRDTRPWVLNPGAAGRTRTYGGPGYLILTAADGRWRLEDYQLEKRR